MPLVNFQSAAVVVLSVLSSFVVAFGGGEDLLNMPQLEVPSSTHFYIQLLFLCLISKFGGSQDSIPEPVSFFIYTRILFQSIILNMIDMLMIPSLYLQL